MLERILFMGSEVNDGIANALVAQMLYLDSEDSSKPIYLSAAEAKDYGLIDRVIAHPGEA